MLFRAQQEIRIKPLRSQGCRDSSSDKTLLGMTNFGGYICHSDRSEESL